MILNLFNPSSFQCIDLIGPDAREFFYGVILKLRRGKDYEGKQEQNRSHGGVTRCGAIEKRSIALLYQQKNLQTEL